MMDKRKLFLYIACSLDGYIAGPGDDLGFLDPMHMDGEDYGYQAFISGVDCVILGRKTYDWVMSKVDVFHHADKETYVVTRTPRASAGNITFYSGSMKELVTGLKAKPGGNIFCDGGGEVIHALLVERLIDEMIISVVPVLLGGGTRLFGEGIPGQEFSLVSCRHYETGLVQLQYRKAGYTDKI